MSGVNMIFEIEELERNLKIESDLAMQRGNVISKLNSQLEESRAVCCKREKLNLELDAKLRETNGKLEAREKHIEILKKQGVGQLDWRENVGTTRLESGKHVIAYASDDETFLVFQAGPYNGLIEGHVLWAYFDPPKTLHLDEEKAWQEFEPTMRCAFGERGAFAAGYRAAKEKP